MIKDNFVASLLDTNKKLFTKNQFEALMTVVRNPFDFRKKYEERNYRITYLPNLNQRVESKLAVIGLEMLRVPANDGTGRKRYAIRPIKK